MALKVLLDENIPERFRYELTDFDTYTVRYRGWKGVKNGGLIRLMIAENFQLLITFDQLLAVEHQIHQLPLSILVVKSNNNWIDDLLERKDQIIQIVHHWEASKIYFID